MELSEERAEKTIDIILSTGWYTLRRVSDGHIMNIEEMGWPPSYRKRSRAAIYVRHEDAMDDALRRGYEVRQVVR